MGKYKATFKKSVAKDLRNIPKADVKSILERIEALCHNPRAAGCIKLATKERYRARQGRYRIVYEIRDAVLIVHVVRVGHRSSVYQGD